MQETWLAVVQGIGGFEGRSVAGDPGVPDPRQHGQAPWRARKPSVPWSSLATEEERPDRRPDRFRGPGDPWAGHWREFPAPWPSPEQETLSDEVHAQVARALAELPDRQRVVITLRDVEGYSSDEVCSNTGHLGG